jgi:hypothetical protein
MTRSGRLSEWYRFLDAHSDEEAAAEVRRHVARLDEVYANLHWEARQLASSPGGEVEETLRIARTAVAEAAELLEELASRFRAGERDAS